MPLTLKTRQVLVLVAALSTPQLAGCAVFHTRSVPHLHASRPGLHPLAVDYRATDRVLLDTSINDGAHGVLVFGYRDGVLEHLAGCRSPGTYTYRAEDNKQLETEYITDSDQLHARLPAFGANFEGKLRVSGALTVRMRAVGRWAIDHPDLERGGLQGGAACSAATHVASHVTVGAFRLFASSANEVSGAASAPLTGPSLSGGSASSYQVLNQAGTEDDCSNAEAAGKPPKNCGTALSLVLAPLDGDPVLPEATAGSSSQRTAAYMAGGAGLAGLIAGGAMGIVAKSNYAGTGTHCSGDVCDSEGKSATDKARSLGDAATVVFGIGAAALGAGIVLWATAPSPNRGEPRPPLTTGIVIEPQGLALHGTF